MTGITVIDATITVTARDTEGDTATQTIAVTVSTRVILNAPADQTYTVGTAMTDLTLSAATNGTTPYIYTLTPAVPGLTFDAETRQLTGTPMTAGTYNMTYRVTDSDASSPDSASSTFMITVLSGPDIVVEISVSDTSLETRHFLELSATVRNQGVRTSSSTTLRYYLSLDSSISTSDTQVGTDYVGTLLSIIR